MKRFIMPNAVYALLLLLSSCSLVRQKSYEAPLLRNLGDYSVSITTKSGDARKFFNQGIILANGFNHMEAARSFKEAARLDSTCAMAYWGIAYVLGPNYNSAGNLGEQEEIRSAVRKAIRYGRSATEWEKALIDAIAIKFPLTSPETDSEGYAEAMRRVYQKFPDDDLIVTLFAESIMNNHAWDMYTRKGGEPRPWTPEIVALLEKAMSLNPDNPLANHLYLHAVEAAPDVEKALPSAERLKTLVPGAGHLVHMPSHIYINTGDYYEGSEANEKAVIADSIYIAECRATGVYPQLLYPHNYHFLAATASLEGRGARAIEASFKLAEIIDRFYLREKGFETTQHFITVPYNVLVKFAQWEKILALPKPGDSLVYPGAIWHYARGMALANTNQVDRARKELESLTKYAAMDELKSMLIFDINSMSEIAEIARLVLQAEIASRESNLPAAIELLTQAIVIEDRLNYTEPPDWFFSVRHTLGDLYIAAGDPVSAERIYREDLQQFPRNGFALNGLYHSLSQQGRKEEAAQTLSAFNLAWRRADSALKYSRIDPEKRQNLAIRVTENSAPDLMYIAGSFCSR